MACEQQCQPTTNFSRQAHSEKNNSIPVNCPWMINVFKKSHQAIFYYYMAMLVTALALNTVLLVLVFRFKITRKQTLTIYISYIAVTDILSIIVHYTQIVHSLQYFSGLRWSVSAFEGVLLCPVNRMLSHFIPMLSSWIVVVMATERWVSIRWPLRSASLCTTKNAVIALSVVTMLTFLVTLPFAVSFELAIAKRSGVLTGQAGHIQCRYPLEARWWHDRIAGIITNVYEVAGNVLPGVCLLIVSILLLTTLKVAVTGSVILERRCSSAATKSTEKAQKRLTIMITAIAASFTVLMLPNAVYRTYYYYWNPVEVNCIYVVKLLIRELLYALKCACCIATPLLCVFGGIDLKKAAKRNRKAAQSRLFTGTSMSTTVNGYQSRAARVNNGSLQQQRRSELLSPPNGGDSCQQWL